MIYYRITTLATGSPALSVKKETPGPGSQLIVTDDAQNDFQLWSVSFHESDWNVGITLINKATGLLAVPEFVGDNAKVIQAAVPADFKIPDVYAWQTNSAIGDANIDRSIMPLTHDGQALACWHPPNVITYNWQGGKGREKWKFTQVVV